ncbi:MAG: DUF2937 family protein [Psychromonas sp.]|nr:DUF2937 family protein [Alteromonadales bacterium]MCP5078405.1 DUF2937 family protein [Psychromonas sp.]
MILSLVQRYSLKISFALALLLGLQIPHFLTLYETRLDAHYQESLSQLKQYQKLADLLFGGDLNALVNTHKSSDIALFRAETEILEKLITRVELLKKQKVSLQGSLLQRLIYLSTQVNRPLFNETQKNYQANIVLDQQSITVGLIVATLLTLLLEMIYLLTPLIVKKVKLRMLQTSIN